MSAGFLIRKEDYPNGITTPADVQRFAALLNPYLSALNNLLANGATLTANISCEVQVGKFTHNVAQQFGLELLQAELLGDVVRELPNLHLARDVGSQRGSVRQQIVQCRQVWVEQRREALNVCRRGDAVRVILLADEKSGAHRLPTSFTSPIT